MIPRHATTQTAYLAAEALKRLEVVELPTIPNTFVAKLDFELASHNESMHLIAKSECEFIKDSHGIEPNDLTLFFIL